jgi:PAS domain S-box-containing protein
MFGYSEKEAIGKPISIIATPDRVDEFREIIERVKKGITVERYETQRKRKNGTVVDVWVTVSPVRNEEGKLIGLSAIDRDITALKQASQYARSLIEASLDPLVTISADGKITDVNEATVKVTGVSRDKLIGADFSNYFTEPEKAREGYQLVFSKGTVTDYPLTIHRDDGKLTDVLYNASVYKDIRGNVLGVFAAARDVTAQKQASLYARSLIEASLDPLVTISADGKITDVNEATIRATGVPREKLIGADFANYFTEPEKAREGYKQVLAKSYVTDYPLTIRHSDGKLTDVLYNASVYKDVGGNVLGVFAAARDITAQKQVSQYARSLIEASLDPLVTISPDGKITDVNEATIKVTGLSRKNLIGTDFSNYFTEPEKAREGYQLVFSKGTVTDYPLTLRRHDGTLTNVLYNASVYKDVEGNVLGVFAAARDITAQRSAEAQVAEQRSKELERLAELERFQKLTVGRELKMIELKKEIEEYKRRFGGANPIE